MIRFFKGLCKRYTILSLSICLGLAALVYAIETKKDYAWMQTHIQKELSSISEITSRQLDNTQKILTDRNIQFMRIKIISGKLSYFTLQHTPEFEHRIHGFLRLFKKLRKSHGLPDLDLIIVLEDCTSYELDREDLAPVFCISKLKTQSKVFSIPEIHSYPHLDKFYAKIKRAGLQFAWKRKSEVAFWRGSTTGGFYNSENWKNMLRTKLVLFSKTAPQVFDCAFSNFLQGVPEAEAIMRNQELFGTNCDAITQLQYKYLIAVDGNTFPSSLKWQLFSGSVVLRNQSDWVEWFDGELLPFQHYIPFESDFSDLQEKINWLKMNDHKAKKITNEALKFAQTNLTSKGIELYVHKLMIAYSKLQRDDH